MTEYCDDDCDCEDCMQLDLDLKVEHATQDVPWKRSGHPRYNSRDGYEWDNHVANIGVSPNRLYSDERMISNIRHEIGAEERAFAIMWDYWVNGRPTSSSSILDHILGSEPLDKLVKTDRDRFVAETVAQSVIQWLGTNCGGAFIEESRGLAKSDKERLREEIHFINVLDQ